MITVTALTKQYGKSLAVDDLTFEVTPGREGTTVVMTRRLAGLTAGLT